MSLYNQCFAQYSMSTKLLPETSLGEITVTGSDRLLLPFGASEAFAYPLKEGETLSLDLSPMERLSAPVAQGEVCGTANVCLNGKIIKTLSLVTLEDAPWKLIPQAVRQGFTLNLGTLYRRWLTILYR